MKYQVSFHAKRDIFTRMLFSRVKISPLLWLHNKLRLSQEKNCFSEMVWYFIGVALIREIFFNTREISYLRAAK